MEFSRPGDLIAPRFPIIFQLFSRAFSTRDLFDIIQASVGRVINKSGVKMTQNAPEQMFLLWTYCSCWPAAFYYTLTLHMPTPFLTVIHCFGGGTTLLALFAIIIDVDFDVELENLRHRFCHHRLSLWMQLMKPQWNGPLLRSCIWSVLLWRCFFFTFWSGIALMSLLWRPWATKILPPIPAIEGSVKQDLSLFAQISFFVSQIHISIMGHIGVKVFFPLTPPHSLVIHFLLCCTWSMLRCYVFSTV